MKRKKITKVALILSVVLMIAWSILGTGATIAWFTDATPAIKNSFVIGQLDLDVYYKNDIEKEYAPVERDTEVFNRYARYEPNYTQVVYLRVENNGDIPFQYKFSVDLIGSEDSVNVYGLPLHLPKYLRYGVVYGDSEADLTRQLAQYYADHDMEYLAFNQYSKVDDVIVAPGGARYVALVVYMPWETGNEANYMTGQKIPQVFLGLTVFAQQADAPLE